MEPSAVVYLQTISRGCLTNMVEDFTECSCLAVVQSLAALLPSMSVPNEGNAMVFLPPAQMSAMTSAWPCRSQGCRAS